MIGAESGRMRLLLGEVVDEEGVLAPRLAFELNTLLCLVRRRRRTIVVADDTDVLKSSMAMRMSMVTVDGIEEVIVVEGVMFV